MIRNDGTLQTKWNSAVNYFSKPSVRVILLCLLFFTSKGVIMRRLCYSSYCPITAPNPTNIVTKGNNESTWWRGRAEHINEEYSGDMTRAGERHPNGSIGMIVDPSPRRLSADIVVDKKRAAPQCASATIDVEGEGGAKVLMKIREGILK